MFCRFAGWAIKESKFHHWVNERVYTLWDYTSILHDQYTYSVCYINEIVYTRFAVLAIKERKFHHWVNEIVYTTPPFNSLKNINNS